MTSEEKEELKLHILNGISNLLKSNNARNIGNNLYQTQNIRPETTISSHSINVNNPGNLGGRYRLVERVAVIPAGKTSEVFPPLNENCKNLSIVSVMQMDILPKSNAGILVFNKSADGTIYIELTESAEIDLHFKIISRGV